MSDETINQGSGGSGLSRRTVMKGAAWSVPVVMVASAAPALAASRGPLSFTGKACKLPGNSSPTFKGYVMELVADNVSGPNPLDAMTVITQVSIGGINEPVFKVVPKDNLSCGTCDSSCGNSVPDHKFCTVDGVIGQRILVYTGADSTGNSANTNFCVWYQRYDCAGGNCTLIDPVPVMVCSGVVSTPTAQDNPGNDPCLIEDTFPVPAA